MRSMVALSLCCLVALTGCDTNKQLLQQELDLLHAEEKALIALEDALNTVQNLEDNGRFTLFFSTSLINGILTGASDYRVTIPGVNGAELFIKSMTAEFKLGLPLIRVEAVASRQGLQPQLDVSAVAKIEPILLLGDAPKLLLKMHIDSLVPRAKWGIFDWQVGGFVRDLSHVKLSEQILSIGTIEVPLETEFALSIPAKASPTSLTGAHLEIHTPQLELAGRVVANQVLALPDGLHVYGTVSTKGI